MEDILIYIDEKERLNASVAANAFTNSETRNRAYINTLGADLVLKYLSLENIDTSKIYNIHSIKKILETLDVADVRLNNIDIDVRMVFDENIIFIPKSHFEYEITPNIYIVLHLAKDFSHAKCLGFFEPQLINKNNQNNEYYFIEKEKLTPAIQLKTYIENFQKEEYSRLSEEELNTSEQLMIAMADNNITKEEKIYLLKQLTKSAALRDRFIEFENFETLAYKSTTNIDLPEETYSTNTIENFDEINNETFEELTNTFEAPIEDTTNSVEISTENFSQENLAIEELKEELINIENITEIYENNEEITLEQTVENPVEELPDENIEFPQNNENYSDLSLDFETIPETVEQIDSINNIDIENFTTENTENINLETLQPLEQRIEPEEISLDNFGFDNLNLNQTEIIDTETISLDGLETIQQNEQDNINNTEEDFALDNLTDNLNIQDTDFDELSETTNFTDDQENSDPLENIINEDFSELAENYENQEEMGTEFIDDEFNELIENSETIENITEELVNENFTEEDIISTEISPESSTQNTENSYNDDIEFDEIVANTLKQNIEENQEQTESFGKNLLENLSAEELDNIPLEDLGIDTSNTEINTNNLLSEVNNILDTDIKEETPEDDPSKENVPNSLEVLFDNAEPQETYTEFDNLENIESIANNETSNIPGAHVYEKQTKSNKSILTATILFLVVAATSAFLLLKPKDTISNNIDNEIDILDSKADSIEQPKQDIPNNNLNNETIEKNIPVTQKPVPKVETTKTPDIKNQKPINTPYLSVDKLVWNISDDLSNNPKIQNYLKAAGKSIKLSLSADLLLATEYAYSNQVKVNLKINKNGSIQSATITSSSGSTQIDNIVLQSVKETLNVVKPPTDVINTPNFDLSLIISL